MTVYTPYPRYAVYPVPYMTLSHRFRNRMTVYGFQQAVYIRRIYGHIRRIYGENRIWTVYEPYMFEGVKKLQAFEGLKISDFRLNLLIHQFLCFNCNGLATSSSSSSSSSRYAGGVPCRHAKESWEGSSMGEAIFCLNHMQPYSPLVAIAAGRFLSAHVTRGATERNWSLFGNISSKTRNRLHLEKAQKLAFIRANSSLGQAGGLDEEIRFPD